MNFQTQKEGFHTAISLLLYCARTQIDVETATQIRAVLRKKIDWGHLIQLAHHHRVIPLLYRSLIDTCSDLVPKSVLEELEAYFRSNLRHNLFLTGQLIKLLHTFKASDIQAIPYKGPLMAASIYGNLALRQFNDLDILVHERDYRRTKEILISQGFRSIKEFDWETSYLDPSGRVTVDLHQGLTSRLYPFSLDFEGLWRRLEPISIGGATISQLSPEDMLIILCIQLAKDGWEGKYQLAKICDIAEQRRIHQYMDWKWIMEEVRRLRSQRILLVCLTLTAQVLGTVLPKEVLRSIQVDPLASTLASQERKRVFEEVSERSPSFINVAGSHCQFRERVRDKIYPYYVHFIVRTIVPSESDRAVLSLPEFLFFLYYLIRPFRLSWIAGKRLCKHLGRKLSSS